MKIVILDGYTLNPGDLSWKGFKNLGDLTVYDRTSYDADGTDLIVKRSKDADAIIINKTPISRNVINNLPNLKYIGVLATGYNVVDIDAAKEKGIIVTNVPTYGTHAVAQMTFSLLLELTNHVGIHNLEVKSGKWSENPDWSFWKFPLVELSKKTLGIIGYGRIGQKVGEIGQAFGMNVIATAKNPRKELESGNMKYVELEEILSNSDVITLHCPLNDETRGIINKDSIEKMKDNAIIINTSRGELIVEEDLAQALNKERIAAAALDVVSVEPINKNNPLLKSKNTILTPHISWAPKESRNRLMDIVVKNLAEYLKGQSINVVNK